MTQISYFDIGANLTHESFDKDFTDVIEKAKLNNIKKNLHNKYFNRRYKGFFKIIRKRSEFLHNNLWDTSSLC